MKKKRNELLTSVEFNKKIATNFHNKDYYKSGRFGKKNIEFMKQKKLKTQHEEKLPEISRIFLNKVQKDNFEGNVFHTIRKIFLKNQEYAFGKSKKEPKNSDLLSLLANEDLLIFSYKKIKKNSDSMSEFLPISINKDKRLIVEEKSWVNKTAGSFDDLSKEIFRQTSKLIKTNQYPWDVNRQIALGKLGKKNVQIPITIPTFMDKVIQEALTMILMAIYEPYFEAKNCSFGFRPNKGVHDAIIPLTGTNSVGMIHALEGDIKGTYDRVNKDKLIKILNKKIEDRKFLEFIRRRLDYQFYGSREKKYLKDILALTQGGIDLQYLWNIYMSVFDDYTIGLLQKKEDKRTDNFLNKFQSRFVYVRYAHHWIILTNMEKDMLKNVRLTLSKFLKNEFYVELLLEKTLITNLTENSANFLGFEIQTNKSQGKIKQIKTILTEQKVFNRSNKQKLINILHMKGYCDKKGFPKEVGFLTNLEDFSIIERFNLVLTGLALYYAEFIKNPKKDLKRLIYIIRYSCVKTLAQKHKTTMKKIFKKYRENSTSFKNRKSKEKTLLVKVQDVIADVTYSKIWRLKTSEEIISNALKLNRKKVLNDIYWKLEKGEPHIYLDSEKFRVTNHNHNYVEKINWINIRTQSKFNLICFICGSEKNLQKRHIKHVRKNNYDLMNQNQIQVCRKCHISKSTFNK